MPKGNTGEPSEPDRLEFIANLCDRQSALMLSGRGDRCLIELEAFDIHAALAHVGMAKFAGKQFKVTIEEIQPDDRKLQSNSRKIHI